LIIFLTQNLAPSTTNNKKYGIFEEICYKLKNKIFYLPQNKNEEEIEKEREREIECASITFYN
jgi:hypothetical protein